VRHTLLIGIVAIAIAPACGRGAEESHNSSQAGATARAGVANPGNQPTVTLEGCLTDADQVDPATAVGTIGRASKSGSSGGAKDQMIAGRGSPGERFTLTQAKSGSAQSNPSAGSYVLDGNLEDLRELADQQVRVTGTLDAAASNTAGPQRVRVTDVESLGSRCGAR
jgi:hypothetical protein